MHNPILFLTAHGKAIFVNAFLDIVVIFEQSFTEFQDIGQPFPFFLFLSVLVLVQNVEFYLAFEAIDNVDTVVIIHLPNEFLNLIFKVNGVLAQKS